MGRSCQHHPCGVVGEMRWGTMCKPWAQLWPNWVLMHSALLGVQSVCVPSGVNLTLHPLTQSSKPCRWGNQGQQGHLQHVKSPPPCCSPRHGTVLPFSQMWMSNCEARDGSLKRTWRQYFKSSPPILPIWKLTRGWGAVHGSNGWHLSSARPMALTAIPFPISIRTKPRTEESQMWGGVSLGPSSCGWGTNMGSFQWHWNIPLQPGLCSGLCCSSRVVPAALVGREPCSPPVPGSTAQVPSVGLWTGLRKSKSWVCDLDKDWNCPWLTSFASKMGE